MQAMNSSNVYWYSKPSPFTGITFLKNPVNSATMRKIGLGDSKTHKTWYVN